MASTRRGPRAGTQGVDPDRAEIGEPVPGDKRDIRAQDDETGDKDIPDDGGSESDRGTIAKRDRTFDDGPAPNARK